MNRTISCVILALGISRAATLPYQGLSTDAKGNPRADGSATAAFSLYTASTGGTAAWTESQSIATKKGLFSTSLGSVTAIPDSLFDGRPLWLGVALDGGPEGSPRLALGSVPFANGAGTAKTARHAAVADSAGKVAGLQDSVSVLRGLHAADSAKIAKDSADLATIRDSVRALNGSIGALTSALSGMYLWQSNRSSIPWTPSIDYGTLIDLRDGHMYRTVKIGSQTWMAENLNYGGAGMCYGGSADSCSKYGRIYSWKDVMNGASSSSGNPSGVQGICPSGWHIPSDTEWQRLESAVGMSLSQADSTEWRGTTEGTKLRSSSGWVGSGNGTDVYGFRILPSGRVDNGTYGYVGSQAEFWTSSEFDASFAWHRLFSGGMPKVLRSRFYKPVGNSLRCLQD